MQKNSAGFIFCIYCILQNVSNNMLQLQCSMQNNMQNMQKKYAEQ